MNTARLERICYLYKAGKSFCGWWAMYSRNLSDIGDRAVEWLSSLFQTAATHHFDSGIGVKEHTMCWVTSFDCYELKSSILLSFGMSVLKE